MIHAPMAAAKIDDHHQRAVISVSPANTRMTRMPGGKFPGRAPQSGASKIDGLETHWMMSPRIARLRPANGQPRLLRFVSTPEVDALMSGPPAMSRIAWSRFGAVVCRIDRKSTRLNSSHVAISYAVFCLK